MLKSNGSQDIFITGNPQITFFKAVYRRHTNFAIEVLPTIASTGTTSTDSARKLNFNISKVTGQLIHKMWLDIYLPAPRYETGNKDTGNYINWTNNTGHAYVNECEFFIGGHSIDKHTGLWLDVYNELNDVHNSEHLGLNKHLAKNTYLKSNKSTLKDLNLCVPLQFWFCRNPGLALPTCALSVHDVKLSVSLRNPQHLVKDILQHFNNRNQTIYTRYRVRDLPKTKEY